MPRYLFNVTLTGVGEDADEAWEDAIEQFSSDPGEPADSRIDPDDPFLGCE